MNSGAKFKKRVVAVFLLGTLASTALLCSDKLKPHQLPAADKVPPVASVPAIPPPQKPVVADSSGKLDGKVVEPAPVTPKSGLNLRLPKQEPTLTESDIVLQSSPHNIKDLLTDTQGKKESPISVGGNVFLVEEEKKIPDPNARVMDQVKGGEVNVKVKTK